MAYSKLVFINNQRKGSGRSSWQPCGEQLSEFLSKNNIPSECHHVLDLQKNYSKNNLYIVNKPYEKYLKLLDPRGSFIYNVIDHNIGTAIKNIDLLPWKGVLLFTEEYADCLREKRPNQNYFVAPHYISPDFRVPTKNFNRIEVGVMGAGVMCYPLRKPPAILEPYVHKFNYNPGPWGECTERINLHVMFRDKLDKPNTKILHAAYCNSNILCARTAGGAIELLGEDYPYLCDFNTKSLTRTLNHAKASFGKEDWKFGLSRMANILKTHGEDAIIEAYASLLRI